MRHAITRIELTDPDGFTWECQCGTTGEAPKPIAALVLREHLEGR